MNMSAECVKLFTIHCESKLRTMHTIHDPKIMNVKTVYLFAKNRKQGNSSAPLKITARFATISNYPLKRSDIVS